MGATEMETAAPTLSGLSREEKLALLRRLARGGAPPDTRPAAELPREDERPGEPQGYPASFAQRRLWFLERLEPGTAHNNIFRAVRLVGSLDREALGRAVAGLVRRHEAFRTRFAEAEGEPVQVVEPAAAGESPLRRASLAGLPEQAREEALQALARADAAAPFDLARAPLARFTLVELGLEEAALLVTIHHAVADGWSLAIVFRELSELYRAQAEGVPAALAAVPMTYGAHARGQRERLSGDGLAAELEHWKAELAGAPEVLDLPTDRPRPALATFRGGVVPFELPAEATDALRSLAREERATPFAALLAAFAAVLGRWSGQDDLLLGVPVAGRPEPELEGVVGFFANTLVVRAELHGRPTFRGLLRRVRGRTLAALSHQEVPFEHLVEELRPQRDLSRNPLYQAMFALQTMPRAALSLGAARIEPLTVERGLAKVDLTLDLVERDGRLVGYLEHNLDLFDRTTATRLSAHVRRLLEAAAADPDRPLDTVELLTAAERHLLLHEGQGAARALPAGETVDALIRRRAAADPDGPAVCSAGGSWTYGQLRRAAGRVARELAARGVAPGDRVAVRAGRSREAVAAFLGVLEAGCAYVPLDPDYPEERLAFMLRDSGARVLLSGPVPEAAVELTGELAAAVGEGVALVTLDADRLAGAALPDPAEAPEARNHPEQAAYVLYTSGTTGRPKGVVIPHRALLNHALAAAEAYELGPQDRVLQFASTSFDIAGEEIYPSLLSGASLTLRPEGVAPSPAELAAFVAEHRLSVVNVPTPLWHEWVAELADGHAAPPPCLRLVVVGTEGALPEPLTRWREALERLGHPDRPRWVNAYGPTEGTITATVYGPARGGAERLARVPVGRPFANVRAHVLDRAFRPAPLGVPGELCLGGPGLAWGYLGRPAATAAAFVPDPLPAAGGRGARLYRTGDRARHRADGEIEFLGRTDHQVKIRGFRIEPGEVEAVLAAHPGVREAVVVAREAGPGDRRLVAYTVEESPGAAPPEALRDHLAGRLPAHMVPAAVVRLPRLPMTPAGKVDRRALPEPEWAARGAGYAPPQGPVEELLAGIWAEVLGRDGIGVRDDFFELGGHSLLAARVAARIRDRMGVEVPLRRLFEARTVETLARAVAALRQGEGLAGPPPIRRRRRRGNAPASFAQQRLWFLDRLEPGSVLYNMPARVALEPPVGEELDVPALARALAAIVRRHESLRTTFRRGEEGRPVQVVRPDAVPALSILDLAALPAAAARREAARRARIEGGTPFDLERGPLVRFRLLRLPGEGGPEHSLLFTAHHTVSDGWSTDLLLGELTALYRALREGRPSPLPELPVQYGDFAVWQQEWLGGEALRALLDFWRDALEGAPPLLELPADRPRPPSPSGRGGRARLAFAPELTGAVHSLARRAGATPFMVLLAAWAVLLSRRSGAADVPVGVPVAGRSHSELEPLIGFFANTVVVRAALGRRPAFSEVLGRVRDAALAAYAHQDLPFEKLVEELRPERNLAHHPLFQVLFAFQNTAPVEALELEGARPGLEARLLPSYNDTARFDLALNLWEHGGRVVGYLEHSADLFDGATAARMVRELEALLRGAAASPEARADELPVLGAAERHALLVEGADTAAPFPAGATLAELAATQAERTPNATALVFRDRWLSYGALSRRTAGLARRLRALGVGPGAVVGVCAERSPEMVLALHAVVRAGAAYLPVDPSLPVERLAFLLEDAGARVLVTQAHLAVGLAGDLGRVAGAEVLALDPDGAGLDAPASAAAEAEPPVDPLDLAYVIYTSGSTGKPKGVGVPHRGIVNRLTWMQRAYPLDASDRVLQKTPFGFDVSVWEFFWPLLTGARLVVAEPHRHGDAAYLADTLEEHRVTTAHFVPSMLQVFLEDPRAGAAACLRRVIASGEALPAALAARFFERLPGVELHNLYGPTEASVDVTARRCLPGDSDVPIGRPIDNVRVYVLDPAGRPAPRGVPGELHLGGVALARGYLGRPALSAERFVPDPFADLPGGEPGGRLYRTGDLCRVLPGGEIEFLGRIDFQVKVRGLRIELGEIESVLAAHPAVQEVVVTARATGGGDSRLVAYLVAAGETPSVTELRRHLGRELPEYMIPGAFVFLDAMPLSANGKVDRRALPEPGEERPDLEAAYAPPRGPVEEEVARIWGEVLRLDRIGSGDNFFELGGHSLLATQVVTRVEEAYGVELPLRALFESPTVAGLAERIVSGGLAGVDEDELARLLDDIDDLSAEDLDRLLQAGGALEGDMR